MDIDAYAQCPGGTGKKIKFCCPDFLGELEKIDRMIEGEQMAACLKHIEKLREQPANRDRQCLLAYQTMLLRGTGQIDAAQKLAEAFLEKYPTNQAALAELSLLAVIKNDDASAMNFLQRTLAESKGAWSLRTYHAAEQLAENLFEEGKWLPARALLQILGIIEKGDRHISQMLLDLLRSPRVPLLLKDDPRFSQPPEKASWAERFSQAFAPMAYGDWRTSESNMSALAAEVAGAPEIWRCLAVMRGWLDDTTGCIEALRKYASFDIPLEEAVETEAKAMLLSKNHLGDTVAILTAVWTVKDVDRLQEAMLSEPRIKPVPFDPAGLSGEDSPPPKAVYLLFDRPTMESFDDLSFQSMPRFLGQAFLFGRQTDREARLEIVGTTATELPRLKSILNAQAVEWLEGEETISEVGTASASDELFHPQLQRPMELKPRQFNAMLNDYRRDAILNRWPDGKLGVLDGLSPREACTDAKYRTKLLAAIMVLQYYADNARCSFDMNELRAKLSLPLLESIDPWSCEIDQVPIVRLDRIDLVKLSDEELVQAFQRSVGFGHRMASIKFGKEIIARPTFDGRGEQMLAYITLARMEDDLDRAIMYIEAGRRTVDAAGKSHATWDLEELSLRFARQEIPEALQLIRHIETTHINEPNVPLILTQILVQAGLLRPDGTPNMPPAGPESEMDAASAAEPGKLWTPDGETSGGGGKLWVPD